MGAGAVESADKEIKSSRIHVCVCVANHYLGACKSEP